MVNNISLTTSGVELSKIEENLGIVSGEAVMGLNWMRDWIAGIKDRIGGRVGGYEDAIRQSQKKALLKMTERAQGLGADAVISFRINIDVFSPRGRGTTVGVFCYGTAVKLKRG